MDLGRMSPRHLNRIREAKRTYLGNAERTLRQFQQSRNCPPDRRLSPQLVAQTYDKINNFKRDIEALSNELGRR
jgi:hypothetical protein